ncbi:MAG: hypothetical protein KKE64_07570 [Candidatus Omnitrophica bacterium]|nr:hypothetical protein [Candidatus Omnitrophota bacterium]
MTEEGRSVILFERVPGQDLFSLIGSQELSLREILQIIRSCAQILESVHEAGVIHWDVKPGNIFFTPEYKVFLHDFKLAFTSKEEFIRRRLQQYGTIAYASIKRMGNVGREAKHEYFYSQADDIYSLGMTLAYMLAVNSYKESDSLSDPSRGRLLSIMNSFVKKGQIPQELFDLIYLAIHDGESRYKDAGQFISALKKVEESGNIKPAEKTLRETEELYKGNRIKPSSSPLSILIRLDREDSVSPGVSSRGFARILLGWTEYLLKLYTDKKRGIIRWDTNLCLPYYLYRTSSGAKLYKHYDTPTAYYLSLWQKWQEKNAIFFPEWILKVNLLDKFIPATAYSIVSFQKKTLVLYIKFFCWNSRGIYHLIFSQVARAVGSINSGDGASGIGASSPAEASGRLGDRKISFPENRFSSFIIELNLLEPVGQENGTEHLTYGVVFDGNYMLGNWVEVILRREDSELELHVISVSNGRQKGYFSGVGESIINFLRKEALANRWSLRFTNIQSRTLAEFIKRYSKQTKIAQEEGRGYDDKAITWFGQSGCTVVAYPKADEEFRNEFLNELREYVKYVAVYIHEYCKKKAPFAQDYPFTCGIINLILWGLLDKRFRHKTDIKFYIAEYFRINKMLDTEYMAKYHLFLKIKDTLIQDTYYVSIADAIIDNLRPIRDKKEYFWDELLIWIIARQKPIIFRIKNERQLRRYLQEPLSLGDRSEAGYSYFFEEFLEEYSHLAISSSSVAGNIAVASPLNKGTTGSRCVSTTFQRPANLLGPGYEWIEIGGDFTSFEKLAFDRETTLGIVRIRDGDLKGEKIFIMAKRTHCHEIDFRLINTARETERELNNSALGNTLSRMFYYYSPGGRASISFPSVDDSYRKKGISYLLFNLFLKEIVTQQRDTENKIIIPVILSVINPYLAKTVKKYGYGWYVEEFEGAGRIIAIQNDARQLNFSGNIAITKEGYIYLNGVLFIKDIIEGCVIATDYKGSGKEEVLFGFTKGEKVLVRYVMKDLCLFNARLAAVPERKLIGIDEAAVSSPLLTCSLLSLAPTRITCSSPVSDIALIAGAVGLGIAVAALQIWKSKREVAAMQQEWKMNFEKRPQTTRKTGTLLPMHRDCENCFQAETCLHLRKNLKPASSPLKNVEALFSSSTDKGLGNKYLLKAAFSPSIQDKKVSCWGTSTNFASPYSQAHTYLNRVDWALEIAARVEQRHFIHIPPQLVAIHPILEFGINNNLYKIGGPYYLVITLNNSKKLYWGGQHNLSYAFFFEHYKERVKEIIDSGGIAWRAFDAHTDTGDFDVDNLIQTSKRNANWQEEVKRGILDLSPGGYLGYLLSTDIPTVASKIIISFDELRELARQRIQGGVFDLDIDIVPGLSSRADKYNIWSGFIVMLPYLVSIARLSDLCFFINSSEISFSYGAIDAVMAAQCNGYLIKNIAECSMSLNLQNASSAVPIVDVAVFILGGLFFLAWRSALSGKWWLSRLEQNAALRPRPGSDNAKVTSAPGVSSSTLIAMNSWLGSVIENEFMGVLAVRHKFNQWTKDKNIIVFLKTTKENIADLARIYKQKGVAGKQKTECWDNDYWKTRTDYWKDFNRII